jgi:hypothetical protein
VVSFQTRLKVTTGVNVYFKPARGYHQISRLKTNPTEAILEKKEKQGRSAKEECKAKAYDNKVMAAVFVHRQRP